MKKILNIVSIFSLEQLGYVFLQMYNVYEPLWIGILCRKRKNW